MSMGDISGQGDMRECWLRDFWERQSGSYRHTAGKHYLFFHKLMLCLSMRTAAVAAIMLDWGKHRKTNALRMAESEGG